MQTVPLFTQRGFSLLELSIVIVLLGMIAAVAMPSATSSEYRRLELAASDVADAVRFARTEARRTGVLHGIWADSANDQIRVFRLDESQNPNARIFDVYHPVWKQIYIVQLAAAPYNGVVLTGVGGQLTGACTDPENIVFDAGGVVHCFEPTSTRISNVSLALKFGNFEQSIAVAGYTGRVSVQ